MEAISLIENVTQAYKNLVEVKAIALFGSRAKGTATDLSDINLMVVEAKSPSQSTRAQLLASLADPGNPFVCRDIPIPSDSFKTTGIQISVWHVAEDLICERVSSILKNRRLEDSVIVGVLHESRIIWDPKNQLLAWKSIISPIPASYKKIVIPVLFSEAAYGLEALAGIGPDMSMFFIQHEMIGILKTLHEIVYLINGAYFTFNEHLDNELQRLDNTPDGFEKHVNTILGIELTHKGLQTRWRRICFLTQLVGQFVENFGEFNLKAGWSQLKRTAPFLFDFSA